MTRRPQALLLLLIALALPAPAAAQEDGIVVDPDSPTGKEYALPLESARQKAAGGKGTATPGEQEAPLFGEGIEEAGETAAAGGTSGGSGNSGGGSGAGSPGSGRNGVGEEASSTGSPPEAVRRATSNPGAPDGGAGTALMTALGAAAVLGAGAGAGLLARRRGQRPA